MKLSAVWDRDPKRRDALRDALNLDDGWTAWEAEFLDSLSKQTYEPTRAQLTTLDRLLAKKGYL